MFMYARYRRFLNMYESYDYWSSLHFTSLLITAPATNVPTYLGSRSRRRRGSQVDDVEK
jgi:hypothetical protein